MLALIGLTALSLVSANLPESSRCDEIEQSGTVNVRLLFVAMRRKFLDYSVFVFFCRARDLKIGANVWNAFIDYYVGS